jgi:hypothetical protein
MISSHTLREKGYQIADVAWLKRKDISLGRSASMGIWLNTPESAETVPRGEW